MSEVRCGIRPHTSPQAQHEPKSDPRKNHKPVSRTPKPSNIKQQEVVQRQTHRNVQASLSIE
jgi:hypothetical protein